jgi:hypothetical protein
MLSPAAGAANRSPLIVSTVILQLMDRLFS